MHFLSQGGRHCEERHMVFQYGFFSRICCSLGLVLLFTSHVAPYWITISHPTPMNMGLWSTCTKKSCREIVRASDLIRTVRILMSISVASGVVSVSLAFLTNTSRNKVKWPMISNFATGLISLATMLVFGLTKHSKDTNGSSTPSSRHPDRFNWAYWLGCLATALFLMSAVMDHHWIFVEARNQNYFSGIWKVCTKLMCTSIIAISPNVRSAKALLVLALFCAFVASSFMIFTYRYFSRYAVYRYLVSAMGSFLTASLVFLAMSVYTIRVAMHGNTKTTRITYHWAFYFAWSSCPFFILSGLLGLMAHSHSPIQRLSFSDNESMSLSTISGSISGSSSNPEDEGKQSVAQGDERRFGVLHI